MICWRSTGPLCGWLLMVGRTYVVYYPRSAAPQQPSYKFPWTPGRPATDTSVAPVSPAATTRDYSDTEDPAARPRNSGGAPDPRGVGHPEAGKPMSVRHGQSRDRTGAASYARECLVAGRRGSWWRRRCAGGAWCVRIHAHAGDRGCRCGIVSIHRRTFTT